MTIDWQYIDAGPDGAGFVIFLDGEPLDVIRPDRSGSLAATIRRVERYCEDLRDCADPSSYRSRFGCRA